MFRVRSVGTSRALCLVVAGTKTTLFAPSPCLRLIPVLHAVTFAVLVAVGVARLDLPSRALTPVAWADGGVVRVPSASANGVSLLFSIPAAWARSETRGVSAAASAEAIVSG